MNAHVGDQLVIRSRRVGGADQHGEICEVMASGGEHYRVRWSDGRETIIFPGPDATVMRAEPPGAAPGATGTTP